MGGGRGRRPLRQQPPIRQTGAEDTARDLLREQLTDPPCEVAEQVAAPITAPVAEQMPDPLTDPVTAVRSMPGESSRHGLHVLARDLLEHESPADCPGADCPGCSCPGGECAGADSRLDDGCPDDGRGVDSAAGDDFPAAGPQDGASHAGEGARASGSLLGRVVDVFVGARRLSNWSLWLQLAAAAQLISRWQSSPPIVQGAFDAPDPTDPRCQGLVGRLWRLVDEIEIWGPVDTHDLAESFVASEIAAAAGLSHYNAGQVVDTARALFLSTRLPRTRALLRAGLLDWNKLGTIMSATQALDDEVSALVEAAVISDADLAVAEPLDVLADPTRPGAPLPAVARMNNPTLRVKLYAAIAAIDAEAAARRSRKARAGRGVWGTPQPDGMGKLELITGQEQVAAILTGLDAAAAAAKAAGDARRMDQIRCDHAVHLLTDGAFGTDAYPTTPADDHEEDRCEDCDRCDAGDNLTSYDRDAHDRCDGSDGCAACASEGPGSGPGSGPGRSGGATGTGGTSPDSTRRRERTGRKGHRKGRRRRGLQVRLTVPLSTWLDLADDPAVLDGYGPIPAAIARQIAADAARDHPTTTTWRCVVVADRHRTVLGVGDLIPTPRHDPTDRQATFTRAAEPFCVFPGCRVQAWRCDLDHRIPYHPDDTTGAERGGATCTCNLQPLCRRHHRLRTAGLITPREAEPDTNAGALAHAGEAGNAVDAGDPAALADADVPPGTVIWTTFTGRSYEHRPPAATPDPAPREAIAMAAAIDARSRHEEAGTPMDEIYDENTALANWDRRRRLQAERAERAAARRRRPARDWQASTLPQEPPF